MPTPRRGTFVRESPRYGGPVAALLTGRDALLRSPRTLGVLAVDMPHVSAWTFRTLHEAAAGHDGAFLADAGGRRQLAGVLDTALLDDVRPDLEARLRAVYAPDLAVLATLTGRDLTAWGGRAVAP